MRLVVGRSLPLALLAWSATAVVALVWAASQWPTVAWPLHGAAVAVVLGASAWCADDALAPVVDVTPRAAPLAVAVRAGGAVALALTWVVVHLGRREELPPHLPLLVAEGVVAALAGAAWGQRARRRREVGGGARAALVAVPVLMALALVRPLSDHLPLFPLWPWEPWGRAAVLWATLAVAAVAVAGAEVRHIDRARRPRR